MSIKFASICPHPPVIVPSVGSSYDLKEVSDTIKSMKKLAVSFKKKKPETVIIISPHSQVSYNQMTLSMSSVLSGDFGDFAASDIKMSFKNDLKLVDFIQEKAREQNIPIKIEDVPELDYGALVPLYYLTENYKKEEKEKLKIVLIAYSYLNRKTHFEFGKIISEVCENQNKNIAFVASGDLSHRLTPEAEAGYSSKGKEFDEKLVEFLMENNTEGILNMDKKLIKEAGECGYLSIVVLLGLLSELKGTSFRILSYQPPFGVGYLVTNVRGL